MERLNLFLGISDVGLFLCEKSSYLDFVFWIKILVFAPWNSSLKQMHILWYYTESTFTQKIKQNLRFIIGKRSWHIYIHNQRSAHGARIRDMDYSISVPRMAYTWRLC